MNETTLCNMTTAMQSRQRNDGAKTKRNKIKFHLEKHKNKRQRPMEKKSYAKFKLQSGFKCFVQ